MKKINVNIFPPEGRYFIEKDGTKIRGGSWGNIFKKVKDYRTRNNLPVGNPVQEVTDQACARSPAICHEVSATKAPRPVQNVPVSGEAKYRDRALRWLTEMRKHKCATGYPLGKAHPNDAAHRAAVCATCPLNKGLGKGCSSCQDVMKTIRDDLAPGRNFDERLGGCEVLGADLKLAVHLDEVRVDNKDLPGHCWRKQQ